MPLTILPADGPDPKPLYALMPDGTKRHVTSQGEAAALEAAGVRPQVLASDVIALIPDWRPPTDAQDAAGVVVQQVVGEVRQVADAVGNAAALLASTVKACETTTGANVLASEQRVVGAVKAIPGGGAGGDVVLRIEATRA